MFESFLKMTRKELIRHKTKQASQHASKQASNKDGVFNSHPFSPLQIDHFEKEIDPFGKSDLNLKIIFSKVINFLSSTSCLNIFTKHPKVLCGVKIPFIFWKFDIVSHSTRFKGLGVNTDFFDFSERCFFFIFCNKFKLYNELLETERFTTEHTSSWQEIYFVDIFILSTEHYLFGTLAPITQTIQVWWTRHLL